MLQKIKIVLLKNKKYFFLIMFFGIISCADNIEFSQYKSLKNASWESNKNISFQFDVKDTIKPKNLFINIRNDNNYQFSNLFLITELNFPNGTKIIDTLQYEMADNLGNFLGDGFTELKENKLFYKEKKAFPMSGKYTFSVRHSMRKNGEINPIPFLEGVTDVGFSIEKIEQ